MKLSQYNIISKLEDEDKYIIYNTYSTACVVLNKEMYFKIFENYNFDATPEIEFLYNNGIIVDDSTNEIELVERLRADAIQQNIQNIVILTTTECNARCYYCFEHGIEPVIMTKETADAVVRFCKEKYKDKVIAITWFGGEPLLNYGIIKYVTDQLIKAGYELETHITTNGSLISDEMLDYFATNYKKVSFQITLDDIGVEYAKIKRYVDVPLEQAFHRVMENVKKIIKKGIKLLIRVNFASSQIEKAKEIYKQIIGLLAGYDLTNVNIYMAPLSLKYEKENISNFHGNIEHPFLQMVKLQRKEGFALQEIHATGEVSLLSSFNLSPTPVACGMNMHSRIVVNADGKLYKCHRLVGKEEYCVGDVFSGVDINNSVLKFFEKANVTDEDCKKCSILPICQEGCKYSRLTFGEKHKCSRIKQVKEELVKLYYEAIKQK